MQLPVFDTTILSPSVPLLQFFTWTSPPFSGSSSNSTFSGEKCSDSPNLLVLKICVPLFSGPGTRSLSQGSKLCVIPRGFYLCLPDANKEPGAHISLSKISNKWNYECNELVSNGLLIWGQDLRRNVIPISYSLKKQQSLALDWIMSPQHKASGL